MALSNRAFDDIFGHVPAYDVTQLEHPKNDIEIWSNEFVHTSLVRIKEVLTTRQRTIHQESWYSPILQKRQTGVVYRWPARIATNLVYGMITDIVDEHV